MSQTSETPASTILLDITCTISSYSAPKYEHVGRLTGHDAAIHFQLDVHSGLCQLRSPDVVRLVITTTITTEGSGITETAKRGWQDVEERTLADEFDYVAFGKVYRFWDDPEKDSVVNVSCGGLLFEAQGLPDAMEVFRKEVGMDGVYIMLKKMQVAKP